jgi:valyl-tRNA synthetase
MVIGSTPGSDTRLYEEKIAGYRNFVNKIWNAARFILLNTEEEDLKKKFTKNSVKSTADKWILSRQQHIIKEATRLIENYNFSEAGTQIYDFLWSDLCDWYIEFSKGQHANRQVLIHLLKITLRLLHPFVPFVTEAIWSMLDEKEMIMTSPWPTPEASLIFQNETRKIEKIHILISELRRIRAEYKIDPAKKINAVIYGHGLTSLLKEKKSAIGRLANLDGLKVLTKGPAIASALHIVVSGMEVYLPLQDMFDIQKERERIVRELEQVRGEIVPLENRLKNKGFTDNAPKEVVKEAQAQLLQLQEREGKLKQHQQALEKA